jgi:DNA replication licensing factor MCM4
MTGGGQGVRYADVAKRLSEQASVTVEAAELAEVLRTLEMEGQIMISGEGPRKAIRRLTAQV